MKNMLFIINPYSGKVKIKPALLDVLHIFNEAGYNLKVQTTLFRGHATEIVKNAPDDTDIIVVSGGDGTLNEVITGLVKSQKKIPLGYIPTGSTNDFASTMGLSTDVRQAAKTIIDGEEYPVDVGKFNEDRYFSYIASFGMFTSVSYSTPQNVKNTFGHFAYVIEGVKDVTKLVSYKVKVKTDTEEFEDEFVFGSVTNTTSVGGIVKFSPELVRMNDGLFEIVLVKKPKNINELSKIIAGLTNSNFTDSVFKFLKTKDVVMTFENEMNWSIDGEHQKSGCEVKISNINTAVSIKK